jgi:transcriptional regulator with XRE-family HTH domain
MSIQEICGSVIKKIRLQKGITQEELAWKCEVDKVFIYRIESGINQPTITTLFKLSSGLNISCSDLIKAIENEIKE